MQVLCDNCGASYKIPDNKLVKEVNKATCRKCGHRMLIRRQGAPMATSGPDVAASHQAFREAARSAAAAAAVAPRVPAPSPRSEWEAEDPTRIAQQAEPPPAPAHVPAPPAVPTAAPVPIQARPTPSWQPAAPVSTPTPTLIPAPVHAPVPAPAPAPAPMTAAALNPAAGGPVHASPRPAPLAHDPSGDIGLVGFGVVVALVGALILAVTDGGILMRVAGLGLALWGTLTALFVVVTGSRGRRKASKVLSVILGTLFAVGGAGAIGVVSGGQALASLLQGARLPETEPVAQAETPEAVDARIDALFAEEAPATAPPADAAATGAATEPLGALGQLNAETTGTTGADAAAYVPPPSEPATPRTPPPPPSSTASSARAPASTSSATSSGSSRSSETSTERPPATTSSARTSEPAEPASSGSSASAPTASGMTTLPPGVVDTMMKSNKNIKRCFYQEYKASGGNLGTATIRFKVMASGKVSSAYVTSDRYKGTELDSCLSSATYTVVFPPFSGETVTLEWTGGAG